MKSKCSICGTLIDVKPEHKQYGIKCVDCKKKIATKLAGKSGK
ncbi:MAG: hypothetical protein ACI4VF_04850 [Lachnospirales bacterium]